jgi:hypothetical protein
MIIKVFKIKDNPGNNFTAYSKTKGNIAFQTGTDSYIIFTNDFYGYKCDILCINEYFDELL